MINSHSKINRFIVLSAVTFSLIACGGGGSDGGSNSTAISSTLPANNAIDVARNSTITASFNEDILPASFDTSSFALANASGENTAGSASLDGNNVARFKPLDLFAIHATYTATLSNTITDESGTAVLSNNYNWSFTTADGAWGSIEEISNDLGDPTVPQISVNKNGQAIVVWHQKDDIGVSTNIWANHFDGTNWVGHTLIEGKNNGHAFNPQIVLNNDGKALAIWTQDDDGSGNYSILSRRFDGTAWVGNIMVVENDPNNSGHATDPQITVDSSGKAFAVWKQSNGGDTNIWANYFNGTSWGTAKKIDTDAGFAFNPQIAMSDNGKALAVWQQTNGTRDDIWVNHFSGTSWGVNATQISTENLGDAVEPQVAMNSSGNAQIVWVQDDGNRSNTWGIRFNSSGSFGVAQKIENEDLGSAFHAQIAIDHNDNAIAVWGQSDGSVLNIWASRFDGTNWLGAERIESDNENGGRVPQISIDNNGNALAIWQQEGSTHYVILANRFDGTNWLGTTKIDLDDAKIGFVPQVAFDKNGNALAVWKQVDDAGNSKNIAVRRFE